MRGCAERGAGVEGKGRKRVKGNGFVTKAKGSYSATYGGAL